MDFLEQEITIVNQSGLHGRASALLVETARRFAADIRLVRGDEEVDGKSILDVMTMACTRGTPVKIRARGHDAGQALAALTELVRGRFGEE
jgi:phosphocarrier protein